MKKIILSIAAFVMASQLSFGQGFVQAPGNTGFTYDCDEGSEAGKFQWGFYGPACVGADNGGGGVDNSLVNEIGLGWGQGGTGRMYLILELTTPLDLSVAANQKLSVDIKNTDNGTSTPGAAMPITFNLVLENDGNTATIFNPVPLAVTGTYQTFDIDLSAHIASGQDLSSIKKIIFLYDGCPSGTVYAAPHPPITRFRNFKVGSPIATAINNSTSVVNANLFPNPSTGMTTISGELKSVADVKITLVDMLGQEVKVITEERTSTINTTFDVSSLKKGIYSVVTNIDGAPSKSQMLVVR